MQSSVASSRMSIRYTYGVLRAADSCAARRCMHARALECKTVARCMHPRASIIEKVADESHDSVRHNSEDTLPCYDD